MERVLLAKHLFFKNLRSASSQSSFRLQVNLSFDLGVFSRRWYINFVKFSSTGPDFSQKAFHTKHRLFVRTRSYMSINCRFFLYVLTEFGVIETLKIQRLPHVFGISYLKAHFFEHVPHLHNSFFI
jgi:hypothetical protein